MMLTVVPILILRHNMLLVPLLLAVAATTTSTEVSHCSCRRNATTDQHLLCHLVETPQIQWR